MKACTASTEKPRWLPANEASNFVCTCLQTPDD